MKEIKFDYNKNIDDKEAEEILDNLIEVKKAYDQRREGIVEIINPLRAKELLFAEENLKRIFTNRNAKVNRNLKYIHDDVGTITIIDREITFENPEMFIEIIRGANHLEVFPKTDGTVQMDISYFYITTDLGFEGGK